MLLVLCCDPLEPSRPDRASESETATIEGLGLPVPLVDHDALVRDDHPGRAVRRVSEQTEPVSASYRGWMKRGGPLGRIDAERVGRIVTAVGGRRR
jgi:hypothetical protein